MMKFLTGVVCLTTLVLASCTRVQRWTPLHAPSQIFDAKATESLLRQAHGLGAHGRATYLMTTAPDHRAHVALVRGTLPRDVAEELADSIALLPIGTIMRRPKGIGFEVILEDSLRLVTKHVIRTPPEWINFSEVLDQLTRLAIHVPDATLMHVWLRIQPNGLVNGFRVDRGSGNAFYDGQIMEIVRWLRFAPCKADGVPVECWVQFPVRINSSGRPAGSSVREAGDRVETHP